MQHRFERDDFLIVIEAGEDDTIRTTAGDWSTLTSRDSLQPFLMFAGGFLPRIALWSISPPVIALQNADLVRRIALDIRDPDLHRIDFEMIVRAFAPTGYEEIVRVSPVPPRVAGFALTLPLRVLVVDPAPGAVKQAVSNVFGSTNAANMHKAMVVEESVFDEIRGYRSPGGWPVTDVVHFQHLAKDLTLAWLSRLADVWQTRLIILDANTSDEIESARALAAGLVRRGGPAVVIRPAEDPVHLYDRIVHDFPLDAMRHPGFGNVHMPAIHSLFGGEGREDLIRFSTIGDRIAKLIAELPTDPREYAPYDHDPGFDDIRFPDIPYDRGFETHQLFPRALREGAGEDDLTPRLIGSRESAIVQQFGDRWTNMSFNLHESEGLMPLADALDELRATVGTTSEPPLVKAERFVNASLWSKSGTKCNAKKDRLAIGTPCQFRLQIGARDVDLPVYRLSALLEEKIRWTPEMKGVWIEIGVTGQGFRVDSDPLQELWLPRFGPTEPVTYAVTPMIATPVLRYSIYCNGSILQTFRLAAMANEDELAGARVALAQALGIPLEELPEGTYVSRLDFSGGAVNEAENAPPRTISIVANHTHGERVVTVKGKGFLLDEKAGDIDDLVEDTRTALYKSASNPTQFVPSTWPYAYGPARAANENRLRTALPDLADNGWMLFQRLFSEEIRDDLLPALEKEKDATISVAHILLEEVIPWAVVYDRLYDKDAQDDGNGNPIGHDVCLAALPVNGELPARRCGELATCLLHPTQIAARAADPQKKPLLEKTVACPLHFWGFQHVIEVPPQQAAGDETKAIPRRVAIRSSSKTTQLLGAVNTALPLSGPHVTRMAGLTKLGAAWKESAINKRDALLKALTADDLDVIYFYCHARGGLADPTIKPVCLELQEDAKAKPGRITAAQLAFKPKWEHNPLVFLNGCSTAAFSPDALSPFVRTFVRDRGAAGVIGTEIPVHETLAGDVAYGFLTRFLGGKKAGEALLAVRRDLLENANPLGLVYTLYAYADLVIARKGDA